MWSVFVHGNTPSNLHPGLGAESLNVQEVIVFIHTKELQSEKDV